MGKDKVDRYQYAAHSDVEEKGDTTSRDICMYICENTSAHGLPHITHAKGSIKKTFWSILTFVFMIALVLNIESIATQYASRPVSVVIALEHEDKLSFPSVVICNMSPVRLSLWNEFMNITNGTDSSENSTMNEETTETPLVMTELYSDNGTSPADNITLIRRRKKREVVNQLMCEEDWQEEDGRCFLPVYHQVKTFSDARAECSAEGGDLAIIDTEQIQKFLYKGRSATTSDDPYWVGLEQVVGSWGFNGVPTAFTNWKPPEPDGTGPCVRASRNYNYQWMDKECSEPSFKAACSLDQTGSCPSGWIDSGVWCHAESPTTVTGDVAEDLCKTLHPDATLGVIDSQAEQTFLTDNVFDPNFSYWIGIQEPEATAQWIDGTAPGYTNWVSGAPGDEAGCLSVADDGGWEIADCETTLRFVCEKPMANVTVVLPDPPPPPEPSTCDCSCCDSLYVYQPPVLNDTLPDSSLNEEPKKVEGSKVDRPVLNADFAGGEDLIETLATLSEENKRAVGYKLDELMLDCQFEGSDCSFRDFARFHNPIHGNCFMFSAGWNKTTVKQARRTGRRHGLHLTINIDQDDYHPDAGDTAGVRVVVHTPDRMPFPEDEGITVAPGAVTYVGLTQVGVERKEQPYGDCIQPHLANWRRNVYEEFYPVNYTVMACQKTCTQKRVMDECHCADAYYPDRGAAFNKTLPRCSSKNVTQGDCKFRVENTVEESHCDCPNSCYQVMYDMDLSTGMWPSDLKRETVLNKLAPKIPDLLSDPNDASKYQRNLLKLEIYYKEFNFERIYEKPAYSFGSFASDLGGVLGLWFGFSLLTLFEFVEFLVDMVHYWTHGCGKKHREANRMHEVTPGRLMRFSADLGLNENVSAVDNYERKAQPDDPDDSYERRHPAEKGSVRSGKPIRQALYSDKMVEVYPPPYQRFMSKLSSSWASGSKSGTPPPTYMSKPPSELYY